MKKARHVQLRKKQMKIDHGCAIIFLIARNTNMKGSIQTVRPVYGKISFREANLVGLENIFLVSYPNCPEQTGNRDD